jgi:peroxiredoxin Q/BCP
MTAVTEDRNQNMTKTRVLKEGDAAPDFELPTDGGGTFRLKEKRGKPLVLYSIDFSTRRTDFDEMQTLVVGVSPDSPRQHDKFKDKHGLAVTLAADEDKRVAEAYGVWVEKSMYGRKYMGVDRSTFLIDRNGVIARIWRGVKVPGHVDEVLDTARVIAATTG